jgi:hypothetical protein
MPLRPVDHLGRPLISDSLKAQIEQAFTPIPEDKRAALLVLVDEQGARMHFAAKIGDHWKVAAGGGWDWTGKPQGAVAIQAVW